VETVRRSLESQVKGALISEVVVYDDTVYGDGESGERIANCLKGRRVTALTRRGKFLLLHLDDDWVLIVHLRMTGQFYLLAKQMAAPERLRFMLHLTSGERLCFNDLRRFGRVWLVKEAELGSFKPFQRLAPDPLEQSFDRQAWAQALAKRKAPIKNLLLNQSLMSGLGNIYVDEALFRAGIFPLTPANELSLDDLFSLHQEIKELLKSAIRWRGTTYSDYVDGRGVPGEFAQHLYVYRRQGKLCRNCKTPIQRTKLGGRGTHFCPTCQAVR